jgi:glutamate-1-semialdehyde 2,1-aminomutase
MIDTTLANLAWGSLAALASYKIYRRLGLSRVKHPSLTGHSRMAKAFTRLVPRYAYDEETWLGMDHAEASIVSHVISPMPSLSGITVSPCSFVMQTCCV